MNPRTTFWLAVLAVGLFAYLYFVDLRRPESHQGAPQAAKLLPPFTPGSVTSVEITQSNQTVRAEWVNDRWQRVKPPYPAQSTAIDSFIKLLTQLQRENEIAAQEIISKSGGLSPFGLDPAWATIKVQAGTNLLQLRVGSKTLLGNRVYVQPVGATGIFMTDAALVDHVPESAARWRNPLLVPPDRLVFDRIGIISSSRPLQLERDSANGLWRLLLPLQMRADFSRVEYLVQQLRTARVSRFVSDDPTEDLERYGLQTPEAELTLALGTNAVYQVQFGRSPTNDAAQVYARSLSHTNVVLVSRELLELVEKPYTEFRDRVLISFRPGAVDRIDAQADESFSIQRRSSNEWDIVEPFQAPADRQLMQLFLENLAKLEVIRFEKDVVTDFAPYGLAKPARQYLLQTSMTNSTGVTNQPLVRVDFGANPTNEWDKVYCRRSDENSVYVVSYGDMLHLERAAFALRDRRIWHFAPSNVVGLTVTQRGQELTLARDPATKTWLKNDQVRNAAIEETLHRLGELQADDWIARGEDQAKQLRTDGSQYQLVLDLSGSGQSSKLTLKLRLATRGQIYAAVTLEQGQPVVFKFPADLYALLLQYLSVPIQPSDPP